MRLVAPLFAAAAIAVSACAMPFATLGLGTQTLQGPGFSVAVPASWEKQPAGQGFPVVYNAMREGLNPRWYGIIELGEDGGWDTPEQWKATVEAVARGVDKQTPIDRAELSIAGVVGYEMAFNVKSTSQRYIYVGALRGGKFHVLRVRYNLTIDKAGADAMEAAKDAALGSWVWTD